MLFLSAFAYTRDMRQPSSHVIEQRFFDALDRRDGDTIKQMLATYDFPKQLSSVSSFAPIHRFLLKRNGDENVQRTILTWLLDYGFSTQSEYHMPIIYRAVGIYHPLSIVQRLLDYKAPLPAVWGTRTLLTGPGSEDVKLLLVQNGVDPNERAPGDNTTPLINAIVMEEDDLVATLLSKGADVNAVVSEEAEYSTALEAVLARDDAVLFNWLILHGADPLLPTRDHPNVLHAVSAGGRVEPFLNAYLAQRQADALAKHTASPTHAARPAPRL